MGTLVSKRKRLIKATQTNDIDTFIKIIKTIIDKKEECELNLMNKYGNSILHLCCRKSWDNLHIKKLEDIAIMLVETFGKKINDINHFHVSVSIMACHRKMIRLANKLINIYGLDCNVSYKEVLYCWENGNDLHKLAIKYIDTFGKKRLIKDSVLCNACADAQFGDVLKIIEIFKEECVPGYIMEEFTALMWTIQEKNEFIAIKLIETFGEKCIPSFVSPAGYTPLNFACFYSLNNLAIKLLEKFGEKCNIKRVNDRNKCAYDYAVEHKLMGVVSKLNTMYGFNDNLIKLDKKDLLKLVKESENENYKLKKIIKYQRIIKNYVNLDMTYIICDYL